LGIAWCFGYQIRGRIAGAVKPEMLFKSDKIRRPRRSVCLDQAEYRVSQARGRGYGRRGRN
jgi:hypothetical protein